MNRPATEEKIAKLEQAVAELQNDAHYHLTGDRTTRESKYPIQPPAEPDKCESCQYFDQDKFEHTGKKCDMDCGNYSAYELKEENEKLPQFEDITGLYKDKPKKKRKVISSERLILFESFWRAYPSRWIKSSGRYTKVGKELAWQQFGKLSEEEVDWALFAVYKEKSSETIPDAHRWLRDKKFKDFDRNATPVRIAKPPDPLVKEMAFNDKRRTELNKLAQNLGKKMKEGLV